MMFPTTLNAENFKAAFREWMIFRQGLSSKVKNWPVFFTKQLEWLATFGPKAAREILALSIRNGWQGLFEPKNQTRQSYHANQTGNAATNQLVPGGEW